MEAAEGSSALATAVTVSVTVAAEVWVMAEAAVGACRAASVAGVAAAVRVHGHSLRSPKRSK